MAQSFANFKETDAEFLAPLYGKGNLNLVAGLGTYLQDASGKRYLDFVSGIAVNALGHCHPSVVAAIRRQAEDFIHISNLYPNKPQIDFAEKLLAASGFDKAFFCNSGTEANEGAIKFARKYFNRKGLIEKQRIVTFVNSFHGRTFAALSATGQPALREGFGPMPGEFEHVVWNDTNALCKAVNESTCAIMLEPLAAEGGVMTISEEMVKTINELREKFNCLVIADEVQTGVGRLGTFLGSSKYGLNVDIVSLAKAVGGGLPLGVVLMRSHVAAMLKPGDHGTTFGGNPLACAAGLAVVNEVTTPGFMENVILRSEELKAGLAKLAKKYSFLGSVHGDGLLLGIETEKPVAELIATARENGLLVHRAGANVLRLLPPLNVSKSEVEDALSILDKACSLIS
jgi:predicted acetylornithine/succinylornithine family transaminase